MIKITSPLKQQAIIELLDNKTIDHYTFKFKYKERLNLYFEVNGEQKHAAHLAKKIIEMSSFGKTIFFNVSYEWISQEIKYESKL